MEGFQREHKGNLQDSTRMTFQHSWSNGCKMKEERYTLDIRKECIIVMVGRHWNKYPKKLWMSHPGKCSRTGCGSRPNVLFRICLSLKCANCDLFLFIWKFKRCRIFITKLSRFQARKILHIVTGVQQSMCLGVKPSNFGLD